MLRFKIIEPRIWTNSGGTVWIGTHFVSNVGAMPFDTVGRQVVVVTNSINRKIPTTILFVIVLLSTYWVDTDELD
jgi:hypothetical protein